jgi:pantetheine-phosphate adenylyltransferase
LVICDRLTVAVARNLSKSAVFDLETRVELLRATLPRSERLEVVTFDGLVVDFCRAHGQAAILRGLRNATDFDYERQMAHSNRDLAAAVESVFLIADPRYSHLSSSLIKEIARYGGDLSTFVDPLVAERLRARLSS